MRRRDPNNNLPYPRLTMPAKKDDGLARRDNGLSDPNLTVPAPAKPDLPHDGDFVPAIPVMA